MPNLRNATANLSRILDDALRIRRFVRFRAIFRDAGAGRGIRRRDARPATRNDVDGGKVGEVGGEKDGKKRNENGENDERPRLDEKIDAARRLSERLNG